MKGLVYKSTGSWYQVQSETGDLFNARMKGVMKLDEITSTNPIAVGDEVEMEVENEEEHTAQISAIAERRNYINRRSPHNRHQHHIVAANLDQCLLIATLREPRTSMGFTDRFLVVCEAYHIPGVIVLNKTDLYRKKELEMLEEWKEVYAAAGYRVCPMSLLKNEGVEEVRELLRDKTTLLSGHSGVGKSSFINSIFPELALRTKEVSNWSGKGMHTTTFAEMFDLPFGGRLIDTPGMREFGLVDIPKQELSHYFPEMRNLLQECQFNNCLHMNEPGCAIKAAVNEGRMHVERYLSYCAILDSIEENKY